MPIATTPASAATPATIQRASVSTSIALRAPSVSTLSACVPKVCALPKYRRAAATTRGTSARPETVLTRRTSVYAPIRRS